MFMGFVNLLLEHLVKRLQIQEIENKITDEGVKAVAELLKTNTTIQVIDLSGIDVICKSPTQYNVLNNTY